MAGVEAGRDWWGWCGPASSSYRCATGRSDILLVIGTPGSLSLAHSPDQSQRSKAEILSASSILHLINATPVPQSDQLKVDL